MFHYDLTLEDGRIIATEHRVPLVGEELAYAVRANEAIKKGEVLGRTSQDLYPLTKHDGTFDVLHVDALSGQQHTINLTHQELAWVVFIAMTGDDGDASYDRPEIKKYQELMKEHEGLSIIP